MLSQPSTPLALSKPSISLPSLPSPNLKPSFRVNNRSSHLKNRGFRVRSSESKSTVLSNGDSAASTAAVEGGQEEDSEAARLFEKLKDAERERIDKLEKFENKANLQLERQLVMASCWSRTLLSLQGKLKGTEWDPENSHRIDYSDFWRLLNSNNVQYMEYSNFGQSISGMPTVIVVLDLSIFVIVSI